MSVLQGNPDLVEQPVTRGRDGQSGPFITRTWRGTEDACNAALDEIIGADHVEVTGDGAVYQLTARFANDPNSEPMPEVPQREERLHYNRVTKSIYNHPKYGGIDEETKNDFRFFIEDHIPLPPVAYTALELELLELLKAGVTDFVVNNPVVIVTDTASAAFAWPIGFVNVGNVLSKAAMLDDAGLASGWAAKLPQDTGSAAFHAGWLKGPPEITTVGGNRSQLVQEFEYDAGWVSALYTYVDVV